MQDGRKCWKQGVLITVSSPTSVDVSVVSSASEPIAFPCVGKTTDASPRMTGIIPIQNYQVVIYEKLGFTNVFSLILTGIWGTNGCFSALIAITVVDKLGCRPLLAC